LVWLLLTINQTKEEIFMKKTVLTKVLALLMVVALFSGSMVAMAADGSSATAVDSKAIVSPKFVAIISCGNNLTLNSGGRLTCDSYITVQPGFIASLTMELRNTAAEAGTQ
jgi:hypothetical protein